ncbi:MAG: flagellar biosynthesis anti-sigma factor FlgM [Desulfobacterales bacterium]|jgi:negative regulator of flagellin synthesis FlgM|nr:flagellar biosynthesis anti-sigma factor FlgM [Desulfobacterales bacterium]
MQITDKNQTVSVDAYVSQVQAKQKAEPVAERAGRQQGINADTVVISDAARRIQEAQKQLQAIPDVRIDKVAELRAQIENGSYAIKPDAIAGRMIRESLLNDLLK